jgi:signal transduction histidine kinase
MSKLLLICLLGISLPTLYAQKTTFTFSDTYPTNNVDSLENWLKTHPQPTEERLKNLIRLKRTYFFEYPERKDRDTLEMRQLSQRLNQPVGKIIIKVWGSKAFKVHLQAFKDFEALKDTSGMIYTLSGLASSNYNINGLEQGDKYAAKDFLMKAKQLLKARFDAHDYFILERALMLYQNSPTENDLAATLVSLRKALALSESNPQYKYIRLTIKALIGTTYSFREEYASSYATYKEILAQLKPDQINLTILVYMNLASDCDELGYYDEKLALCEKIAFLLRTYPENKTSYLSLGLYESFKNEMDRRGRYKEASIYGDSISVIKDIIYEKERKQKLIEFQAQNKQTQIAELTLQQNQIESRNRLTLLLLGIALVVVIVFGYLGIRLRQANTRLQNLTQARDQFFGIVAHDLRRPMYAFQGIKALVGFHLRRHDYAAIEKLSVALDESGVRLQKMLDNLVAWAMSQQESLPYQPEMLLLRERVETIVDLYEGVNLLKNVQFEVNIPDNLTVYADPNALDLVVRNMIDNSFKALPQAGNLRIMAQTEADTILVQFADDAGGMPASKVAVIQRVFDAPEQAQIGQDGMGMGLIMVGRFVKRNRGRIGLESQTGKGTTFWLKLPKEQKK